jgi:hypothetical protein
MERAVSRLVFVALASVTFWTSVGYCSDPATHMAVAMHTLDVWQDFDPAFYAVIAGNAPDTSAHYLWWLREMTLKFYLIGTTLPDLFFEGQQQAAS